MNECKNIPVELILSTKDTNLYEQSWKWNGTLFWSIECLPNKQINISDSILPTVKNYSEIKNNPEIWDFCKCNKCKDKSEYILVVFTFKPDSIHPDDYLQYVIDLRCCVVDKPDIIINDNSGKDIYFDINVKPIIGGNYVELWLEESKKSNIVGLKFQNISLQDKLIIESINKPNNVVMYCIIILLIIILLIVVGYYIYIEYKNGSFKFSLIKNTFINKKYNIH